MLVKFCQNIAQVVKIVRIVKIGGSGLSSLYAKNLHQCLCPLTAETYDIIAARIYNRSSKTI